MSAGSISTSQAGDAAERQPHQSPGQAPLRDREGYAIVPTSSSVNHPPPSYPSPRSSSYQPSYTHTSGMSARDSSSAPSSSGPLPSIAELVRGTRPEPIPAAVAQAPVPSGPGPPTSFPAPSFAARPPDRFSDPGARGPLNARAPAPTPLNLHNGQQPSGPGQAEFRRESDPRQAADPTPQHLNGGYSSNFVPHQPVPPTSGPPTAMPYAQPGQLPPGQYPLPALATPASPRQAPSTLPSPFGMHNPPSAYQQQPPPGQERYEMTVDRAFGNVDYGEALDRIRTYSGSMIHFAESYIRAAREQNGGHPIQSRLPTEGEIRNLVDHTYIIQNCLKDIRTMVGESQQSDRATGPPRDSKERDMVMYEQHQMQMQHAPPIQQMPPQQLQQHHGMQQPLQHPMSHQQVYGHAEVKHSSSKRRGVSQEPGHSTAAPQPRYADAPRKRAAPPGRCHSCNRVDTPEWRRGPDGARTLCNACGLHYAKLERKKAIELKSIRPKPGNDSVAN